MSGGGCVTVLYGGELAAEIAEKIAGKAKDKGRDAEIVNMSDFKKVKLGESEATVIFVVQVLLPNPSPAPPFCILLLPLFSALSLLSFRASPSFFPPIFPPCLSPRNAYSLLLLPAAWAGNDAGSSEGEPAQPSITAGQST
jgi:hypothetical protein